MTVVHVFISLFVSLSLLQLGKSLRDLQYRVSHSSSHHTLLIDVIPGLWNVSALDVVWCSINDEPFPSFWTTVR
jgi:hypothetical protein